MAGEVMNRIILMLLLPALFGAGSAYAQNGDAFRPLHDIEDALDPIGFANYDGVRYYGIDLSKNAAPLLKYAERIFSRPAYIEALTPSEKVMRT